MKKYSQTNLKKMYDDSKWYMFIPLIGFFIYMAKMTKYSTEAGLMDDETPGGAYMWGLTKKFFIFTNIFMPVWSLFVAIMFNFMFFFWKAKAYKALKMNSDANLY